MADITMGVTTENNEQTNTNELANRFITAVNDLMQLQERVTEEAIAKLPADHQKITATLQQQESELASQKANHKDLLQSKSEKTNELAALMAADREQTKAILPAIQLAGEDFGLVLPEENILLQDTKIAQDLIDQVCNKISAEKNPLQKPSHYTKVQSVLDKVEQELQKDIKPLLILQNIDAIPELMKSKAPTGFLFYLKLIKQPDIVIQYWTDFKARYESSFRFDPTIDEYKEHRKPLLTATALLKQDSVDFLQASQKNEVRINTLANTASLLQQIKTTLSSNGKTENQLNTDLVSLETNISKLAETINTLDSEHQQKALEEKKLKGQLQEITDSGHHILDDLISLINSQSTPGGNFADLEYTESTSAQQENALKLASLEQALNNLPTDETLQQLVDSVSPFEETPGLSEKFKSYLAAKSNAVKQLQDNKSANERLLARIDKREELVIDFRQKLENYLEARNRRYIINDTLSIDGKMRAAFIETLSDKLDTYYETGDKQPVIRLITKYISEFPGNNLQAILNRISIGLIDFDKQVPKNFTDLPPAAEDLDKLRNDALGILATRSVDTYSTNIDNLYIQISNMKRYGEKLAETDADCGDIVNQLAEQLHTDLDRFVVANGQSVPDEVSFLKFKNQFTARLHSQDDEMSKHRAAWKPILGNILIGVLTLGIALGFKLVISKLSTGRASFFFDETARQEKIQSIDQSLQALTAPAA